MINKEKLKPRLKKTSIRFALALAALGIIAGGLASFNFMGTTEQTVKMNKFEFSTIDIAKATRILKSFEKDIKDEDLESSVIEWFMFKETYKKMAKRLNIEISEQEIADYIKDTELFHNENGQFSPEKYKNYLRVNVIDAGFYESLVKDELLVNKLKSIIDPEIFSMKDPELLSKKLNKEYDTTLLVADTSKMTNFSKNKDFIDFVMNSKEYSSLIVNLKIIKHGQEISIGEFNLLKNKEDDIKNIMKDSKTTIQEVSIKELMNKFDIAFLNEDNYHYKDSKTFYYVSFKNERIAKNIVEKVNNQFQFQKKTDFINSYVNEMIDAGKSLNDIYESQDYFELKEETLDFQHPIFSEGGKVNLLNVKEGEIFYIQANPFYTLVKVNTIKETNTVKEEDFKEYYQQNMMSLFLKMLDKKAADNY